LRFLQRLEPDAQDDDGLRLELAQAYVRVGNVQGQRSAANLGDRKAALQSYQKARQMIAPMVASGPASWEAVKTSVDVQLAIAYALASDDSAGALSAATAALDAASAGAAHESGSLRSAELLARAHFGVAVTSSRASSLRHWEESNRLFSAVLASDAGNDNAQRNVALTEKYLGAYFEEDRDVDKMLEHHQRAYAIDQLRAKAAINNRQAQIDLALDLGNISYAYELRRAYTDAIDYLQKSLEIRERLSAGDPKDAYGRGRVAHALVRLGELYRLSDQVGSAERNARAAIAILESLGMSDQLLDLGSALYTVAVVESKTGRAATACATYSRAASVFGAERGLEPPKYFRDIKAEVDRANAACRERRKSR
jgi:non-specific serine/threonine protein kinase/serine/threonine-protein kinase